jgi:hypothetical protein
LGEDRRSLSGDRASFGASHFGEQLGDRLRWAIGSPMAVIVFTAR